MLVPERVPMIASNVEPVPNIIANLFAVLGSKETPHQLTKLDSYVVAEP